MLCTRFVVTGSLRYVVNPPPNHATLSLAGVTYGTGQTFRRPHGHLLVILNLRRHLRSRRFMLVQRHRARVTRSTIEIR